MKYVLFVDGEIAIDAEDLMAIRVADDTPRSVMLLLEEQLESMTPERNELEEIGSVGITVKLFQLKEAALNE